MPSHAASATTSSGGRETKAAAERRDRAERAAPVAARGELERGDRARRTGGCATGPAPRRGPARRRRAAAAGALGRRDRQQRAPVDGDVRGRGAAAEHVVEALGELRDSRRSPAPRRPRAGSAASSAPYRSARQPTATTLAPLPVGGVRRGQQGVDRVLLRLLDEPAGVDDDDVRSAVATVGVDELPAAAGQPAGELLGVDLVARAAQGEQRGPPRSVGGADVDATGFRHAPQGIRRPVFHSRRGNGGRAAGPHRGRRDDQGSRGLLRRTGAARQGGRHPLRGGAGVPGRRAGRRGGRLRCAARALAGPR